MIINYDAMDSSTANTVRNVEMKPHVRYIRYLLTKKYSPINIKRELQRLGLSAPHEPVLVKYYLAVIDPLVKDYKLGSLYSDYKNKLMRSTNKRTSFSKYLLNFRIDVSHDIDLQVKFCKFIDDLELDSIWGQEIVKFYGTVGNIPLDENGKRIIKTTSFKRKLETILCSPKRYLIDKMLLENIPDRRIAEYCRRELKLDIFDYDVQHYKQVFFNLKTFDIEGNIQSLEVEQNALNSLLDVLESDSELDLGEKILLKSQTEKRIKELDDNIKTLNAYYSEYAFNSAKSQRNDFAEMFSDVVQRSYERFVDLDRFNDRDVVESLFKSAKIMGYAYEKVHDILEQRSNSGDKHSQFELIKLYRQRVEEAYHEQAEEALKKIELLGENKINDSVDMNKVQGIDELGLSTDDVDKDKDNKDNKDI